MDNALHACKYACAWIKSRCNLASSRIDLRSAIRSAAIECKENEALKQKEANKKRKDAIENVNLISKEKSKRGKAVQKA